MKKTIILQIDDKEVKAEEGMTILDASKLAGVEIPTLCHSDGLEPYGGCRFCSVEIEKRGRMQVVASCCYPIEEGLKVKTKSPKISQLRKTILELAATSAGEDVSSKMRAYANEYNADLSRFRAHGPEIPTKCILCGLCVRRCSEASWDGAIGFVGRGVYRDIALLPGKSECINCNYCRDVCPTGRACSTTGTHPPFPKVTDILAGRK